MAVALVEFGGGLAFAVSTVLRDPVQVEPSERVGDQVSNGIQSVLVDTVENGPKTLDEENQPDVSNPAPAKMVVPDTFSGRLMVLLKDRGGDLYSGHRALGRALGCSAGHVGNVLRDLASAGHVTVQATKWERSSGWRLRARLDANGLQSSGKSDLLLSVTCRHQE